MPETRANVTVTTDDAGPLAGLRVIDLSTTLPGAQATQFLADAGADVILVEGPDGSPLRADPGWPGLLRGKRSIALDLHSDDDQTILDGLLGQADVLVTTMRPAAAARLGLTAERLAAQYPRLVAALITGWGSRGPWADYKGYEALIMAKTGVLHSKRQLTPGPTRPTFGAVRVVRGRADRRPGSCRALRTGIERARQVVEANLVSGVPRHLQLVLRDDPAPLPGRVQPLVAAFDEAAVPADVRPARRGHQEQRLGVPVQSFPVFAVVLEELAGMAASRSRKSTACPTCPTPELRPEWWARDTGARVGGEDARGVGSGVRPSLPTCWRASARQDEALTPSWSTRAACVRSAAPTSGRCAA